METTGSSLDRRIEAEFEECRRRIADFQAKAVHDFEQMQERRKRFTAVAETLLENCGRPLQTLAARFDNAEVIRAADREGRHVKVVFKHTPQFPATVELKLDVTHDEEIRKIVVLWDVSILPVFFDFEKSDHIALDLDALDEDRLRQWIDDKVVLFVRTYLRIQFAEEYQKENLVTDPVAAVRFSRVFAKARSEYRGHTYYFVSEETRDRFEEAPEAFVHM
jgi:YHS domain-containing protein